MQTFIIMTVIVRLYPIKYIWRKSVLFAIRALKLPGGYRKLGFLL